MAMAAGIATGQLSSKRNTVRPTKKKVRPRMRITGREVNMRGIYDFWTPRECMWLKPRDSDPSPKVLT
jgi:hypothetical protein